MATIFRSKVVYSLLMDSFNTILLINSDIELQDNGLYTCQIKTETGQTSASATVTVLSRTECQENFPSITDLLAFPASPSKPKLVRPNLTP